MRLGFFGGTFDPVHTGHLIVAEAAREQFALDRLLFMPAGQPWRKAGAEVSEAWHRIAMLHAATEDNPAFEVSAIETERDGPTYTVETLRELHARYEPEQVVLIIGEDSLADLPNWREPQEILDLASLAVAPRLGETAAEPAEGALPGLERRLTFLAMPVVAISASEIRRRVHHGSSIRYLVPAAVERYIREQRLYRD